MPKTQSSQRQTHALTRTYRVSRAAIHLIEGLATTFVVFPFAGHDTRQRLIRHWSRRLLRILAVDLHVSGHVHDLPHRTLIVANHISWLDIFVLNAHQPSRFIAKSEIRRWPFVGRLVTNVGTIFLDRKRRREVAGINAEVEKALAAGDVIALFPEGTTTFGRELLPFHGSLIQPAIAAGGHVVPAAIRYTHPDGSISEAPSYVGDQSLMQAIVALVSAPRTRVQLHLEEPFATTALHRRQVADRAHRVIRTALQLPDAATGPGTRDDPPVEPR